MHGQVSQDLFLLNERPPDGYTWSGVKLTRKQTTSRPDNAWPDMWKHVYDASKRKAKQKWSIEKPKLDNARKLRGMFFIEPEDEDFKSIMKNARWKFEIPMPAAMPCKTPTNSGGEADDSTRKRLEGTVHEDHEDHIADEGINSLSHCNLVHKFIPMPEAMKIPDSKKNGTNSRRYRHGSQKQKRGDR